MKATIETGQELRDMFGAAARWLEKSASEVDAINVFPVPDGDTGTNMLFTMRSTMEEAFRAPNHSTAQVMKAMAHGALMGARGNSGVILSQVFRGLAKKLGDKDGIGPKEWAEALGEASRTAYQGLSRPVEGTILTVMRDAAEAAIAAAEKEGVTLTEVMEVAVEAAKRSVARTPLLLPVLKEAGVVDAGGQGLYIILDGVLHYMRGEAEELQYRRPQLVAAAEPMPPKVAPLAAVKEEPYGYCTEFIITGEKLDADRIRKRLDRKGQSLVVVGNESAVRVHIHTLDPGAILHWAVSLGTLHQLKIQNMDDQHVDFIEMQKERLPTLDIGIVAVAAGQGITELLQSLGASAIVPGGQTMNPSVRDILQAVETVPSDKVIILPNNKNIILTASQVQNLTSKKVAVVPTKTIPQGVAALLAFNYEGNLEENTRAMEAAVKSVQTIEVTKAVRSTRFDGLRIKRGQYIAIVDDEALIANDDEIEPLLLRALEKTVCKNVEVITLYYGADTRASQAEEMVQQIRLKYPQAQVELVRGGQPHYNYIISLEG